MAIGQLHATIISATISDDVQGIDLEPTNIYATIHCSREQRSTKNVIGQGRLPAWNETLTFDLQEKDLSQDILVKIFDVKPELDVLLGLARVPVSGVIAKEETTLLSLTHPNQGECGQLKVAWKWTPTVKETSSSEFLQGKDWKGLDASYASLPSSTVHSSLSDVPTKSNYNTFSYAHVHQRNADIYGDKTLHETVNAMAGLNMDRREHGTNSMPSAPPVVPHLEKSELGYAVNEGPEANPSQNVEGSHYSYHLTVPDASTQVGTSNPESFHESFHVTDDLPGNFAHMRYPPVDMTSSSGGKELLEKEGSQSSTFYPALGGHSQYVYPPPPDPVSSNLPYTDTYPPQSSYPPSAPLSTSHFFRQDQKGEDSEKVMHDEKGMSETRDKGKGHYPHVPYSYPPPEYALHSGYPPSGYPAPQGYPPIVYPVPYGHSPTPYTSNAYVPAPVYAPVPDYPPYGYPPPIQGAHGHVPYPMSHGHGGGHGMGHFTGAYVGHSSHGYGHYKHHKHHEHHKHGKHYHGYYEPHFAVHGHHKHKKHHHGKGHKFKF